MRINFFLSSSVVANGMGYENKVLARLLFDQKHAQKSTFETNLFQNHFQNKFPFLICHLMVYLMDTVRSALLLRAHCCC